MVYGRRAGRARDIHETCMARSWDVYGALWDLYGAVWDIYGAYYFGFVRGCMGRTTCTMPVATLSPCPPKTSA